MNRILLMLSVAGWVVAAVADPFSEACDAVVLTGRTDKDNPVGYKVGEPIEFRFTLLNSPSELTNGAYQLEWIRRGDDGARREKGLLPLDGSRPLVVRTSLDRPGFVFVKATVLDSNGKAVKREHPLPGAAGWEDSRPLAFSAGAGVEIEKLDVTYGEPADFDEFWRRQLERSAAVPLKVLERRELTPPKPGFRQWTVSIAAAGPRPVWGYLAIPENAAERSLKAVLSCSGYGDNTSPGINPASLRDGEMRFHINAHGFDHSTTNAARLAWYHDGIRTPKYLYAMSPYQNEFPEGCYFNGMALRVLRALDYLKTLPEWNGRDLVCTGGSQGGLQSLWAASLYEGLTRAEVEVPWGGDWHSKEIDTRLRWSGSPRFMPGLAYYDSAFHARRAKCPVDIVRAGLGDLVCPGSTVAVIYNNLPQSARTVNWVQGSTHGLIPPPPVQSYELPSGRIVLPELGTDVFTGDASMLK